MTIARTVIPIATLRRAAVVAAASAAVVTASAADIHARLHNGAAVIAGAGVIGRRIAATIGGRSVGIDRAAAQKGGRGGDECSGGKFHGEDYLD
jgi:hypothetical protein